jgi:hypothetical protein
MDGSILILNCITVIIQMQSRLLDVIDKTLSPMGGLLKRWLLL